MVMDQLPAPNAGQRFSAAGRTGSGKSTLACWLLKRSPQHWVILNPKHTVAYRSLPDVVVLNKFNENEVRKATLKHKYVLLNLSGPQADAAYMDEIISWLHDNFGNIGLCADELYTLHSGSGKAGPGLVGWLTRGREKKQTFLGLTQRPVWVSRFIFSEADFIASMDLVLEDDRETLYSHTGQPEFLDRVLDHRWLCYEVASDKLTLFAPVPV